MTLQDIALLQMVFSVTFLLVSYPTGILINRYGGKIFSLIACLCVAFYNAFCLFSPCMLFLMIANVIYALGLAFMASSVLTWRASLIQYEGRAKSNYINYLGYLENEYQAIWSLIAGTLGVLLPFFWHSYGYILLFSLTSVIMLIFMILFKRVPYSSIEKKISLKQNILYDIKLIKYPPIIYFTCIYGIIEILYQPVFHFWQPLFCNFYNPFSINENLIMGICFFCVNIVRYIANNWVKRFLLHNSRINLFYFSSVIFSGAGLLFILLGTVVQTVFEGIIYFTVLHGLLSIGFKTIISQYLKIQHHENSASIFSLGSLFGKGLGFCFLLFISLYIHTIGILNIFLRSSVFILLILIILYFWNIWERKGKGKDYEKDFYYGNGS